ncbi:hypothetical protein ACFL6R_03955 [Gemmatimonadota bacterium]
MADDGKTRSGTGSSGRIRDDRPLLFLLLGIALFHVVTMPAFFYPGDNFAPRAAAVNLLTTGDIGIEPSARPELESFLRQKGQYFFERDGTGRLYSKYGIGNTLLCLPPLLADRLTGGDLVYQSEAGSLLIWLNLWSIVLTLLATVFIYRIVSLYTDRSLIRIGFILVLWYTTFAWYYLRAPGLEIYQVVPFLGFIFHLLASLRAREGEAPGTPTAEADPRFGAHLLRAALWLGVLVLVKLFFIILIPVVWIFALGAGGKSDTFGERLRRNLSEAGIRALIRPLVIPTIAIVIAVLLVNQLKFGSPFTSGYGQWLGADGQSHDRFAFSWIGPAISSFLFRPGNANIFIHAPSLLVALFGLPAFLRRNRSEALFLLAVIVVIFLGVIPFSSWAGEWCYGPRYLLPIVLIGTLPRIEVGEWLLRAPRRIAAPIAITVGAVLLWSFSMQVRINSLHYFTFHRTQAFFAPFQNPDISAYYGGLVHRGILHRDLIRSREGRREFPPAATLRELAPPERRGEIERALLPVLHEAVRPNYLLFVRPGRID